MLHLATVEPRTISLLEQIQAIPAFSGYRLVGGTALALIMGHRKSVDLDLFCYGSFNSDIVVESLRTNSFVITGLQISEVYAGGYIEGIKVDFVKEFDNWLKPARQAGKILLADMEDLAPMKLKAVTKRGRKRDFVDLYYLLQHFSVSELLALYKRRTGQEEIIHVITSMTYFEDAENDEMPYMVTKDPDWNSMKQKIKDEVLNYMKM
jgi:hypothetical protein